MKLALAVAVASAVSTSSVHFAADEPAARGGADATGAADARASDVSLAVEPDRDHVIRCGGDPAERDGEHLRAGPIDGDGQRSRGFVIAVVKSALPAVDACAAAVDDVEARLPRELKVRWRIDADGRAHDAVALPPHDDTNVGACVARAVAALEFGAGPAVERVTFPFRLRR